MGEGGGVGWGGSGRGNWGWGLGGDWGGALGGSVGGEVQVGRFGVLGVGGGGQRLRLPPLALPLTTPSRNTTINLTLTLAPIGLAMPGMLIRLNKIPPIPFMAAFATSLLSILDLNTHSDPSLG